MRLYGIALYIVCTHLSSAKLSYSYSVQLIHMQILKHEFLIPVRRLFMVEVHRCNLCLRIPVLELASHQKTYGLTQAHPYEYILNPQYSYKVRIFLNLQFLISNIITHLINQGAVGPTTYFLSKPLSSLYLPPKNSGSVLHHEGQGDRPNAPCFGSVMHNYLTIGT